MTLAGNAVGSLQNFPGDGGQGGGAERTGGSPQRWLGAGTFVALAIVSTGGPLALAALYAPSVVDDVAGSAGLVGVLGAVVFALPLMIWLRYARDIQSSGGLFAFVEAAAGRRVALVQASVWTVSYLLYLLYTTEYIVYDVIPTTLPGARPYRPLLEIAIPVVLAGIVLGGRALVAPALCVLAFGQVALVAMLATVAISHAHPLSSFTTTTDVGSIATASGNTALFFVCGSLPLFFGGEVRRPRQTMRRGIVLAYALAALAIVASIFPLAANPAFTHAEIPGMSLVGVYVGHSAAVSIGLGIAASVVGVMLVEYLAVTRLLHAVRGVSLRTAAKVVAVPLIIAGPLSLINPDRFYDDLLKPSLVALWLSQLIVVAVFPRFIRHREGLRIPVVVVTIGAVGIVLFGLYSTIHNQVAT
ncbi:MAG: hypothetical protein ACRDV3_06705 [Acidothermaceae bacterium]